MSFENLKSSRGSNLDKMISAAQAGSGEGPAAKKSYKDERIWKPTADALGNGYAKIRFLPACEGADLPWVQYWDHGFKGPTGQWYIEKSLTTIGQKDPLAESNKALWDEGSERSKDLARGRKRRLHYVCNILVQEDPSNPQNEGKVFLYDFGKTIFDMVMDAMKPAFPDETPIDPFDFWEGASFKIKMYNGENGFRKYDKSSFETVTPLSENEDVLKGIYTSLHNINEFTDPASYKSYDELAARLALVLGETTAEPTLSGESVASPPSPASAPSPQFATADSPSISVTDNGATGSGDEDDTMSYFAQLAAQE